MRGTVEKADFDFNKDTIRIEVYFLVGEYLTVYWYYKSVSIEQSF